VLHNGEQIKVLVIFQAVAGSFKIKDNSIITEGLSVMLDHAREMLSMLSPKHKAYHNLV
jgi:hypothetical protein